MRRVALMIACILTGAVLSPAQVATASALRVYTAVPGVYTAQPTSTNHTPVFHDLGARITAPAGTTKYLSSKLVISQPTVVTETSHLVYCRQAGSTTLVARLVTGQNVLAGSTTTILTRGMVTAPASGDRRCPAGGFSAGRRRPGRIATTATSGSSSATSARWSTPAARSTPAWARPPDCGR